MAGSRELNVPIRTTPTMQGSGAAVRQAVVDAAPRNIAGRALGAAASALPAPLAPIADALSNEYVLADARRGVSDFVQGLIGSPAKAPAAPKAASKAQSATRTAAKSPAKAAIDAAKPVDVTPEDLAMGAIQTILSRPYTLNEFQAATSALPQVVSAAPKARTAKDKATGALLDTTDTLYKIALAQAAKLPEAERVEAYRKATDMYRQNLAAPAGVNPQSAAIAELLAGGSAE